MSGNWNPNTPYIHPGMVPYQGQQGPFDPNASQFNPQGTMPNVAPTWPQSNWTCPQTNLSWDETPFAAITPQNDVQIYPSTIPIRRAVWASSIFDLAPQLLASSALAPKATPIIRGASARLYVEIEMLSGLSQDIFNLYSCERSHPYDSAKVLAVSGAQAITQALWDTPPNVPLRTRLSFAPPDVGCRFWQVYIIVVQETDAVVGALPAINITATCY